jgi:hypothetical protein
MLSSGEYALYLARGEGTAAYVYDFSVDVSRGREAEATHVAVAPPVAPAEAKKATIEPTSPTGVGTVSVTSEPSGADVYSDDSFVGQTPATLKLKPGDHYIRVFLSGFENWSRQLTVTDGSEAHLAVTLKKPE